MDRGSWCSASRRLRSTSCSGHWFTISQLSSSVSTMTAEEHGAAADHWPEPLAAATLAGGLGTLSQTILPTGVYNNTKQCKKRGRKLQKNRRLSVYQPNNNCSVINQPFGYQLRTQPLALLTKQMLYVSYKLNFTPGFLLIRDPSGGSCPPNQHGKRTQQRRPQSLTRCGGDVKKWGERARERGNGRRENMNYRCDGTEWKGIISWWLSDVWFWIVIINF